MYFWALEMIVVKHYMIREAHKCCKLYQQRSSCAIARAAHFVEKLHNQVNFIIFSKWVSPINHQIRVGPTQIWCNAGRSGMPSSCCAWSQVVTPSTMSRLCNSIGVVVEWTHCVFGAGLAVSTWPTRWTWSCQGWLFTCYAETKGVRRHAIL